MDQPDTEVKESVYNWIIREHENANPLTLIDIAKDVNAS